MPHLLVDITAHGYGHVSQTAPVVNELARRISGLRITLRCAAPPQLLRQRFTCEFVHIPVALDFGMKMSNAVDVEVGESMAAYRAFHANWDERVQQAAEQIRALRPDLLLANVPYLSLAAAGSAGVRAAAMCCLNWADIYHYYCAENDSIHAQMLAAYNSAEVFLKVQPAMPMPELVRTHSIGPIAQVGRSRRARIETFLNVLHPGHAAPSPFAGEGWGEGESPTEKLILVAMGGIEYRLPMERWPRLDGARWLVPQAWSIDRDDMIALEPLGLPFGDLLASCDAVLTKPGYGTFAEAACAGVPVLYVSRRGWPEEPFLVGWLEQNNACREVERSCLHSGDLEVVLRDLWTQPRPPLPIAGGAHEAAEILAAMLKG